MRSALTPAGATFPQRPSYNAIWWTRLWCRRFKDNQTRLQRFALAYNLGNFLRQMALPREMKHWSLTTPREKLIKIGAKVVSQSKSLTIQMAEVAVPRALFAAILERIARLRASPIRFEVDLAILEEVS